MIATFFNVSVRVHVYEYVAGRVEGWSRPGFGVELENTQTYTIVKTL
jgi:hypothetical protein